MKRTILGAAMALAGIVFLGEIACGQDSPPATFGLPAQAAAPGYQQVQQAQVASYAPAQIAVPPCGPNGICPPLIPGQAVEPPVDRGPMAAPVAGTYQPQMQQQPYYAPVQPIQQPYYAQMQPVQQPYYAQMQPVQQPYYAPIYVAQTGYYTNQLDNAIPLPPLFPGQVVEPVEERPQVRAPLGFVPGQLPPAVQPNTPYPAQPTTTFAPVTPPAAAAPIPVRVITTITPDQVKQALAEHIPLVIVDVRNELTRDMDGHVPGDLHVPLGPEATFITRLAQAVPNRATPVVFYCREGGLSARAAALALGIGYKPYLMGAYQGW